MTQRSRRVVFVAHCLLNANTRAEGLASWPGMHPVVGALDEVGVGLVQLPCPEMGVAGCDRPTRSRDGYDSEGFRAHCEGLADDIERQAREFQSCEVDVACVIGVEGSPSCAVERDEPGILVETLRERLGPLGIRFVAVDSRDPEASVRRVTDALSDSRQRDGVS